MTKRVGKKRCIPEKEGNVIKEDFLITRVAHPVSLTV
jgi:hypothetical protein